MLTEYAPAKLNLYLHVVGRRADGYHLIDSVMVPVSLCDRLRVGYQGDAARMVRVSISIRGAAAGVPHGPGNLVHRAASAFLSAAGLGGHVSIALHKAIPPASGLGGGSSDAAAVLRALSELCPRKLPAKRLATIAASVGADVPFFLRCRAARVSGIGEIVRPFRGKVPRWFVVAVPRRGVSTAAAYRALALTKSIGGSKLKRFRYGVSHPANDLEKAVIPRRPDIGRLKGSLLEAGAQVALMSGSGSAVFGVFASQRQAAAAAVRMPRRVRKFVVETFARSPAPRRRAGRSPSW